MTDSIYSGKYAVQELIAQGGMGVVYKALDQKLNRVVALKVVHTHLSRDPGFLERFLREARAMARLQHEHIVTIYAVEQDQDTQYLVMEYFPGINLRDHLRATGALPLRDAVHITRQIALALAYAHTHGIIHRDIKPANVLLDPKQRAKLTDFGIAAALDEAPLTSTGQLIGTLTYMSPEQARDAILDGRSDLYSLGLIFYELLTGRNPRQQLSSAAILGMLLSEQTMPPVELPGAIPSEIQQVVQDLLRYRPTERIQDAETLVDRLEDLRPLWASHTTVAVGPDPGVTLVAPPPPQPSTRPASPAPATEDATVAVLGAPQPTPTQGPAATSPDDRRILYAAMLAILIVGLGIGAYYYPSLVKTQAESGTDAPSLVPQREEIKPPQQPAGQQTPEETELQRQLSERQQKLEADLRRLEEQRRQAALEQARQSTEPRRSPANKRDTSPTQQTAALNTQADQEKKRAEEAAALAKARQALIDQRQKLEAEQQRLKEEQARREQAAAAQRAREEEERRTAESAAKAKQEAESRRLAQEAEQKRAAEQAKLSQEREAAEKLAREQEQKRQAAEQAKLSQEREAAQKLAREQEQQRQAAEQAKLVQQREAAEKLAREQEQKRQAAEQARIAQEREAAEQRAREEAQRRQLEAKAAEERARQEEAARRAKDEAERKRLAEERQALEEAKRRLAEDQARLAREREAAERSKSAQAQPRPTEGPPQVASIPIIKPDAALMDRLEQLRKSVAAKDLADLETISTMSESRRRVLEALFENYASLEVSLGEVVGTPNGATALLLITKLVRPNGDVVTPTPIVRKTKLLIPREGEDWGKIRW